MRTSCNNSEDLRATSLLKARSVCIINEKKLAHFCMRFHTPENSNVTKTVSGMFIHFYQLLLMHLATHRYGDGL